MTSSFYDTFTALVNNNEGITDIQRFYYARAILKANATEVIQSVEVTSDNSDKFRKFPVEKGFPKINAPLYKNCLLSNEHQVKIVLQVFVVLAMASIILCCTCNQ